ncbi:MAG TPA: hypothetical protein VE076_05515 [Nitrososphaeraceae archaeon]|nr:hypothetical protein [Nitrososphaeraceae archaeon]
MSPTNYCVRILGPHMPKGAYARNYLKIKMLILSPDSFFITSGEYNKNVVKKYYNGKVNWHFEGSYYN